MMASSSSSSSSGIGSLNTYRALQEYVIKMISQAGMKALILDSDTATMMALVYSQSELIANGVYLIENMDTIGWTEDDTKQVFHHLKAIVFLRPNDKSINAFKKFLKSARYKEYHLFFSNIVQTAQLDALAEADENELVKGVYEYYADYFVVTPSVVHFNNSLKMVMDRLKDYNSSLRHTSLLFERDHQGILSLLLSLRKRPDIRYSTNSELAKKVAIQISDSVRSETDIFASSATTAADSCLLILDRREDPVTPLLMQWTYQAMVHEILGIKHNRIDMRHIQKKNASSSGPQSAEEKEKDKELKEVVLSSEQDDFFRSTMFANYGDLGVRVKKLVSDFQQLHKTSAKLDTVEDMQRFVDNYPEFRKQQGTVTKHVTIMGELLKAVSSRRLMDVSAIEQEIVCGNDHNTALDQLLKILEDPTVHFYDKLRLVMLYAIRYETYHANQIPQLKRLLKDKATDNNDQRRIEAVDKVLEYGGARIRKNDLFSESLSLKGFSKVITSGFKGVENIYTQHKPHILELIQSIINGNADIKQFPFIDSGNPKTKYRQIIVFIVGGITFEESAALESLMQKNPGIRIVLTGSFIHNSHTFIDELVPIEPQTDRDHHHVIHVNNNTRKPSDSLQ